MNYDSNQILPSNGIIPISVALANEATFKKQNEYWFVFIRNLPVFSDELSKFKMVVTIAPSSHQNLHQNILEDFTIICTCEKNSSNNSMTCRIKQRMEPNLFNSLKKVLYESEFKAHYVIYGKILNGDIDMENKNYFESHYAKILTDFNELQYIQNEIHYVRHQLTLYYQNVAERTKISNISPKFKKPITCDEEEGL